MGGSWAIFSRILHTGDWNVDGFCSRLFRDYFIINGFMSCVLHLCSVLFCPVFFSFSLFTKLFESCLLWVWSRNWFWCKNIDLLHHLIRLRCFEVSFKFLPTNWWIICCLSCFLCILPFTIIYQFIQLEIIGPQHFLSWNLYNFQFCCCKLYLPKIRHVLLSFSI